MTANELRQKYFKFFESKGHKVIPSASLIPENDPTVLFTTAGMQPLVPYLMGEKHPAGRRLVNVQKCLRTGDIDEVGDDWHLTFFEMLGNWSLGDYFKKEISEWTLEFLTDSKWLGLSQEKLKVTVFAGDQEVASDEETAKIWLSLKMPLERIIYLGRADNWWGPVGKTGPCGPDSEVFYWTGQNRPLQSRFSEAGLFLKNKEWTEIWNNVFMEYNKKVKSQKSKTKYEYEFLKQKNVDTGVGLERLLAVLQGKKSVYETELFDGLIKKVEEISGQKYNSDKKITRSMRIIADHLRAATFILGDEKGVAPSNLGQGYVLRRLIRRAARYGRLLGINQVFVFKIAEIVIDIYSGNYPELRQNKDFVIEQLIKEEEKFNQTLERGLKKLESFDKKIMSGQEAFDLMATYGFPLELTKEIAAEKGFKIDEKGFKAAFKKHQEVSRAGSSKLFKGGLANHSQETTRLHTAAHLFLAALRRVLGEHIYQKGSNITAERLRFDFSHPEKLTPEQIRQVEYLVNQKIKENLIVEAEEMSLEQAKAQGAMGVFEAKYGERVKVYIIKNLKTDEIFSREICGGPHVKQIGELGEFKIIKEESSSAGVRRIKAVLEQHKIAYNSRLGYNHSERVR